MDEDIPTLLNVENSCHPTLTSPLALCVASQTAGKQGGFSEEFGQTTQAS